MLLAAVTVMMLLPNPKKLMLGYLLGAYATSISLGLLIVFSLNGSGSVSTAKNTLGPGEDSSSACWPCSSPSSSAPGATDPCSGVASARRRHSAATVAGQAILAATVGALLVLRGVITLLV